MGWGDVATKHDLRQLEERLDLRMTATRTDLRRLEERFDLRLTTEMATLRAELHDLLRRQTWTQLIATLTAVATVAGTILVVV